MAKSYLVYWLRDQLETAVKDGLLLHAASEQFGSVHPGDTLWISGPGTQSRLVTVGPLYVSEIVGQREAARRLPYRLWRARFHALASPGEETIAREVPLENVLTRLRFVSRNRDSLNPVAPLGPQLQRLRQLTSDTAEVLEQVWSADVEAMGAELAALAQQLDAITELDAGRQALVRREQSLLRQHLFRGQEASTCLICGRRLPVELFVAAHVKPRSRCTDPERRDLANIAAMCVLGCDAMFNRGWIVIRDGCVAVLKRPPHTEDLGAALKMLAGRRIAPGESVRSSYFEWHRHDSLSRHRRQRPNA